MLNLEDFMNIRDLKQQGWSVSAIADELHLDRKTVRKHLLEAPQPYKRENPALCKIDPYRPFLGNDGRKAFTTPASCWTKFAPADMTAARSSQTGPAPCRWNRTLTGSQSQAFAVTLLARLEPSPQ
jgi:hypothetical protein